MTYEALQTIALAMPEVVESSSYRQESLNRGKRWMLSLKPDGETIAVKLDWDSHDRLLEAQPGVVFKTPHYEGYPAVLVRLDGLDSGLAREILDASWADAPEKAVKRPRASV